MDTKLVAGQAHFRLLQPRIRWPTQSHSRRANQMPQGRGKHLSGSNIPGHSRKLEGRKCLATVSNKMQRVKQAGHVSVITTVISY